MKLLLLMIVLSQSLAFAESSDFAPIPDFSLMLPEDERISQEDQLIEVKEVSYLRNKKASFCTRPTDMIDTIVLHHSETSSKTTPEEINTYHLNRGTRTDPWYMIAYSFVINAAYWGATIPTSQVSVGRPIQIVGAHAGSGIFVPMDQTQIDLWNQKKILCGKEGEVPKFDPSLVKNNKIKANVTTIGIVVNGNYALYNRSSNPSGFKPAKEPTPNLVDMYARLSCQLQRKYPRMKTLAYHNQYHSTSCPGTIQKKINMQAIQSKAKEYGCEFKLLP